MKLDIYLKTNNYITTTQEITDIIGGFSGTYPKISIWELYSPPGTGITILKWAATYKGGRYWGFLRDDSTGWSANTVFETGEDETWLAAQNADYDVTMLKRRGDGIDWESILQIAKENNWGF
jgi:hypothetical protein